MKRILPQEILDAYKKVDFRPTWRAYGHVNNGDVSCGCPLSALACSMGMEPENIPGGGAFYFLSEVSGYDPAYLHGFVRGVDGVQRFSGKGLHPRQEVANIGHDDGTAAWMAVRDNLEPVW